MNLSKSALSSQWRLTRGLLTALVVAVSVGCASNGNPRDPFEPVNRKIYSFNSAVDRTVLEPTARAYKNYVRQQPDARQAAAGRQ